MSSDSERIYQALLIIRFQAGDDSAFAELIRRRQKSVEHQVRLWLGGNSSGAEDICQLVWIDVLKALPRLRQPLAWDAWLAKIVRSQVVHFLRCRSRENVSLDLAPEPLAPLFESSVDPQQVETALAALGEPHQSLLRLRYWDACSYQEIASRLGIPVGTVGSRLHLAKSRLMEILSRLEFVL